MTQNTVSDIARSMQDFAAAMNRCGRAMVKFAVYANNPNASGKKRAFLVREARRKMRAKSSPRLPVGSTVRCYHPTKESRLKTEAMLHEVGATDMGGFFQIDSGE